MILAARLLMATGVDLLLNGKLIRDAKAELQKRIGGRKYRPIFPAGTPIPLKSIGRRWKNTGPSWRERSQKGKEEIKSEKAGDDEF